MNWQEFFSVVISIFCYFGVSTASDRSGERNDDKSQHGNEIDYQRLAKQFLEACTIDQSFSNDKLIKKGSSYTRNTKEKHDKQFLEPCIHVSASPNNNNNEKITQCIDSNALKEPQLFMYKFRPHKVEEGKKLGFSLIQWKTASDGHQDVKGNFLEAQVTDKAINPRFEYDSKRETLLKFIMAESMVKITSYVGTKKFNMILFSSGGRPREIKLEHESNNIKNGESATSVAEIKVSPGDRIFVYSGPKKKFRNDSGMWRFWSDSGILRTDGLLQMMIITLDEPPKNILSLNKSTSDSSDRSFVLRRWFGQSPEFVHKVLGADEAGSSKFCFQFKDLPNIDFSQSQSFSSSVFSVALGNSKVRITGANLDEWMEIKLNGVFLVSQKEGEIPFRVYVYRKRELLNQTNDGMGLALKLEADDEIIVIAPMDDYHEIQRDLTSKICHNFVELLSRKAPFIRIKIQEQPSNLRQSLVYGTKLIPSVDGLRIVEIAYVRQNKEQAFDGIRFNDMAVISGELTGSVDTGYITEVKMNDYVKEFTDGSFSQKSCCIAAISQNNETKKGFRIEMDFNIPPQCSFAVLRRPDMGGDDDDGKEQFWTSEVNTGKDLIQESIELDASPGDCYEIYCSKDPEALKTLRRLNSKGYGGLERLKDFFELLSLEDATLGFMFRLKQVGKINKTQPSLEIMQQTIRNNIITQQWFGGVWMEDKKPDFKRQSTRCDNPNENPWKLFWGYDGNEVWNATYPGYTLKINNNSLLIESRLKDDQSSMKVTLNGYSLEILIQGIVPFTLAVYRGDAMVVSWSKDSDCKFDDLEIGDKMVLIPWTFFLKNRPFSIKSVTGMRILTSSFNSGNLVATIAEP